MRILVVDDSSAIRNRLVEILSTLQGVEQVSAAAQASEARDAIRSARPDLMVLDIHMPGGSGIEVLESLRADDRRIMTIVLTNDPTPQWRAASLQAGADFFFDKSAEFQQAIDVIAHLALGRAATGDPLPLCWTCFDRLPIPSWIFDVDTLEFKAVNDAAVSRYGYSRDEFLAMTMMRIRPSETVPAMREEIARQRSGQAVGWTSMQQHRAKDGTPIYVEISRVPFDRAVRRLELVLAYDISERILVEGALRASENRYRDLFETPTDAIFTTDLDLNLTSLNAVGEALTGYTREEANRVNIATLVTADALEAIQHELANQLGGKPASMFDTVVLTRDGRSVPIEVNARLVYRDGKPVGTQGIARDISERKRLERQFQQARKMDAIGQLAGGLAHDFNNLLTAMLGYSGLLLAALPEDDPHRPDVEEIQKAGQSAESLTRQLLAFSRQQILEPRVLDLNGLVDYVDRMVRRLIGEDIQVVLRLDPELGLVKADPDQIEQIIVNLAVNARDAMPEGGTLIIETANAELDEHYSDSHPGTTPGRYVMLGVSDTGHGMDKQTQSHLFEPFYTTKERGKGTGLGLATVYGIVKQSSGYISVYSELGHGTTFKTYLPRVEGVAEPLATAEPSVEPANGTETILLVEDHNGSRILAQKVLKRCGYTVLEAPNGLEALRIVERYQGTIHLLLTDVVMPGMSGRVLADRLTPLYPAMRVLYTSGYTDNVIAQRGVLTEGTALLQKPYTIEALARRVRDVLDAPT